MKFAQNGANLPLLNPPSVSCLSTCMTHPRTAQGSGRVDQLRQVVDGWGCGRGSRGKGHLHDQADAAGDVHNESGWYSQGAEEERLLWP